MLENFNNYSAYYDLLYRDKNYPKEAEYINDLLKEYSKNPIQSILEIGSGTGKHAVSLANLGYQITGIEPSITMLNIAKKHSSNVISFKEGNATNFKLNQKFDACISLFHVISYLSSNENIINAFKNVHEHLNTDGLFIFDCWYSSAVLTQLPEKRIKFLENEMISVKRIATPIIHWNENIIDVNYNIEVENFSDKSKIAFNENHRMRHFSLPELELIASITGFKVLQSEEFLTKTIPSENTWGICLILQKT